MLHSAKRCMISDHAGPPAAILSAVPSLVQREGAPALSIITAPPLLLDFASKWIYSLHLAPMITVLS